MRGFWLSLERSLLDIPDATLFTVFFKVMARLGQIRLSAGFGSMGFCTG